MKAQSVSFDRGTDPGLCDTLRALGVRSRMSLGVIPGPISETERTAFASPGTCEADPSLRLDICEASCVRCEAHQGRYLTESNPSRACSAFRDSLPDIAHPAANESLVGPGPVEASGVVETALIYIPSSVRAPSNASTGMRHRNIQDPEPFDNREHLGSARADSALIVESGDIPHGAKEASRLEIQRKRVERNRISAAKSNMKKREEKQKLRNDIEQWKAKLYELKTKENE